MSAQYEGPDMTQPEGRAGLRQRQQERGPKPPMKMCPECHAQPSTDQERGGRCFSCRGKSTFDPYHGEEDQSWDS
jgi:hypothetical protein